MFKAHKEWEQQDDGCLWWSVTLEGNLAWIGCNWSGEDVRVFLQMAQVKKRIWAIVITLDHILFCIFEVIHCTSFGTIFQSHKVLVCFSILFIWIFFSWSYTVHSTYSVLQSHFNIESHLILVLVSLIIYEAFQVTNAALDLSYHRWTDETDGIREAAYNHLSSLRLKLRAGDRIRIRWEGIILDNTKHQNLH